MLNDDTLHFDNALQNDQGPYSSEDVSYFLEETFGLWKLHIFALDTVDEICKTGRLVYYEAARCCSW